MSHVTSDVPLAPVLVPELTSQAQVRRAFVAQSVAVGTLLGAVWGASMRAWMALFAVRVGETPTFTWAGTFAAILLPAALAGAWLGWASTGAGGGRRWRWSLLSPLLMVLGPLVFLKGFIPALMNNGLGGGAIAVAIVGMTGGVAASGLGPLWARWAAGLVALAFGMGMSIFVYFVGSPTGSAGAAGTTFAALFMLLLMILLVAGVSVPARTAAARARAAGHSMD